MNQIEVAESYIGMKEGNNARFKKFIGEYNAIKPRARGYKMTTSDPWCAAFVSVCLEKSGISGYNECSVYQMYNKFKNKGKITRSANQGYIVFYSLNGGYLNHTGIIQKVDGVYLYVIEGNNNDQVRVRKILKSSPLITGFGAVDLAKGESSSDSIVLKVIRGEYGNGDERKRKLTEEGYDYKEVQEAVNNYLNSHKK